MGEDNGLRLGVVLWRKVKLDNNGDPKEMAPVEPRFNDEKGDFCFRVNMDGIEPELIGGDEFGLVAISKKEPPEVWTHAVVFGFTRDRRAVYVRFAFDRNVHAYMTFRRALARERECPEHIVYNNMEPGFRRLAKPDMGVRYV